jgi:hypothetical protein
MMKQHTVQLATYGQNVSEKINTLLQQNGYDGWRLVNIFPIPVARIGGPDNHVVVLFETATEGATFRERI